MGSTCKYLLLLMTNYKNSVTTNQSCNTTDWKGRTECIRRLSCNVYAM